MRQVYIVRHGETDWNKTGRFQGQTDIPLNAMGRTQAAALRSSLMGALPFDRIVASDLCRAVETAEILSQGDDTPLHTDSGFREMDFGDWEGLDAQAIDHRWPGELRRWFDEGQLAKHGGETQEQLFERVRKHFRLWADRSDYERLAIVCHGGVSSALMCSILGKPPQDMVRYLMKNASAYLVHVEGLDSYRLEVLPQTVILLDQ